jgi:prolyl 4-hydroxylase
MSEQKITPELSQWLVDQAKAGVAPNTIVESMLKSGWTQARALTILEETLSSHLKTHAKAHGLPLPVTVPCVQFPEAATSVVIDGHEVRILVSLKTPRLVVFANMLSHSECDELIAMSRLRLARSETVVDSTGGAEIVKERTSEGMFFALGENPLCQRLEARFSKLFDWPLEHAEGLQVLRYQVGAEYKPHYDYFDPTLPGTEAVVKRGGQRVGSLIMYLNKPPLGGATTFPDLTLEISPTKGHAVFFSYDRPHPMTRTLHGGAPVLAGEKWVVTKWFRERKFK